MSAGFGFFPYEAMNYKAAQAYLDRKARQGWELMHVSLGCIARFRRTERPSHFVDLDIHGKYVDTDPNYLQLCADAGWDLVQNVRGMLLFRAAEGKSPAPIQTDGEMEWERFWKRYRPRVRHILLYLALIVLVVWVFSLPSTQNTAAFPASLYFLLYLPCMALLTLYLILYLAHSTWYLARCRRSGRVESPGRFSTVIDSLTRLYLLLMCLCALLNLSGRANLGKTVDLDWYPFKEEHSTEEYVSTIETIRAWPVVTATDLGLERDEFCNLDGCRTFLMDYLEYQGTAANGYTLITERYDCVSEGLAKWAINRRRDETQAGRFLFGDLNWVELITPEFDESYITTDQAYLLFRQGKVVALVGCTGLDLLTGQSLEAVRARVLGDMQ